MRLPSDSGAGGTPHEKSDRSDEEYEEQPVPDEEKHILVEDVDRKNTWHVMSVHFFHYSCVHRAPRHSWKHFYHVCKRSPNHEKNKRICWH